MSATPVQKTINLSVLQKMNPLNVLVCLTTMTALAGAHAQTKEARPRISVPTTEYVYTYQPPRATERPAQQAPVPVQATGYVNSPSVTSYEVNHGAHQNSGMAIAVNSYGRPVPQHSSPSIIVGYLQCELGVGVLLEADTYSPGFYKMQHGQRSYQMRLVPSHTGAVRLEDEGGSMVWLQLANKSMLLDQAGGTRLADECTSPQQWAVAQAMKANPGRSLLD